MSVPGNVYVPEDSNTYYIMDWQLADYFQSCEAQFDSATNGIRTSQGCLDYGHWYMDVEGKYEAKILPAMGFKYQVHLHDDHKDHISSHYFELFFQYRDTFRPFISAAPTYNKGDNEFGFGFFVGENYLHFFETSFIIEDIDLNASLKKKPSGYDKRTYRQFPVKIRSHFNKYWETGHFVFKGELTNRYLLQSDPSGMYSPYYQEKGLHRLFYLQFWQDINKLRLGGIFDLKQSEYYQSDTARIFDTNILEIIAEPMIAYKITEKWIPFLYLVYNYKTENASIHIFSSPEDSLFYYKRDIYAYLIDIEYHFGGNVIWHFGMQQQFYYNNQRIDFKERRFILGFEYHYKNFWVHITEALEGDYPTSGWIHNRTYVQVLLKF